MNAMTAMFAPVARDVRALGRHRGIFPLGDSLPPHGRARRGIVLQAGEKPASGSP
jgi:hypothetical protein